MFSSHALRANRRERLAAIGRDPCARRACALNTQIRYLIGRQSLTNRSLIEIDFHFDDGTPATWRFQPAIRQEALARVDEPTRSALAADLARYAAWLGKRAFDGIHQEGNSALVNLVRPTLDTLVELPEPLPTLERLWHLCRVG